MKRIALILMLIVPVLLLTACDSKQEADKQQTAGETSADNQTVSKTVNPSPAEEAEEKLQEAIQAYQDFASKHRDFLWRDTELRIAKAKQALQNGEFDVAMQEADIIRKEVELMKEQVAFAKNNWRKFMVNP